MSSRRAVLKGQLPQEDTNAGLWLARYLQDSSTADTEAKTNLIREVTTCIKLPGSYENAFKRWEALLKTGAESVVFGTAKSKGRLVIGLGNETVLETAIALHHTYGVPYLPGTAQKGLARSYARQNLGLSAEEMDVLFGTTMSAGYITFHDGLVLPSPKGCLAQDVMTPHHPKYYMNGEAPLETDSPVPVPFLTAHGSFRVAIQGPEEWAQVAFRILAAALRDMGIGAKTSSGYGRMELSEDRSPVADLLDSIPAEVRALNAGSIGNKVPQLLDRAKSLGNEAAVAKAIVDGFSDNPTLRKIFKNKFKEEKAWAVRLSKASGIEPI